MTDDAAAGSDTATEEDEEECSTCWKSVSIPVGTSIIGVKVNIDQKYYQIRKLDFVLGGDETTFPKIEG